LKVKRGFLMLMREKIGLYIPKKGQAGSKTRPYYWRVFSAKLPDHFVVYPEQPDLAMAVHV
jgi:hypothetical protein